jgi:PIN domain nuclease of toxin-antitoxin system
MYFIEWEGKKKIKIEVYSYSLQLSIIGSLELFINCKNEEIKLSEYIQSWVVDMERRDLIIYDITHNKYFHVCSALPVILHTNNQGFISSCKFKCNKMDDVTRQIKILNLLK